jgi:hypothetical protein
MSGKIIEFRHPHGPRRARFCTKQAVPRGPAGQARLDQQIARISGLLGQLEDQTRGTTDLPSTILVQARASIEKTSRILQPCTPTVANTGLEENCEDDPQPDVDHGLLERMYRALDLHACATMLASGSPGDRCSVDGTLPTNRRKWAGASSPLHVRFGRGCVKTQAEPVCR